MRALALTLQRRSGAKGARRSFASAARAVRVAQAAQGKGAVSKTAERLAAQEADASAQAFAALADDVL